MWPCVAIFLQMVAYLLGSHTRLGRTFAALVKPEVGRNIDAEKGCNHKMHILPNKISPHSMAGTASYRKC